MLALRLMRYFQAQTFWNVARVHRYHQSLPCRMFENQVGARLASLDYPCRRKKRINTRAETI